MRYRIQPCQIRCPVEAKAVEVAPGFKKDLRGNVFGRLLIFHAEIHKPVDALHIGVVQLSERLSISILRLKDELTLICQGQSGFFGVV
jgi:hypothetical protein